MTPKPKPTKVKSQVEIRSDAEIQMDLEESRENWKMMKEIQDEIRERKIALEVAEGNVVDAREKATKSYIASKIKIRKELDNTPFRPQFHHLKLALKAWELIRQGFFPDPEMLAKYCEEEFEKRLKDIMNAAAKAGKPMKRSEARKQIKNLHRRDTILKWFRKTPGFKTWFTSEVMELSEMPEDIERQSFAAALRKQVSKGSAKHAKLLMDFNGWAKNEQTIHLETKLKTYNYSELTRKEQETIEKQRALELHQSHQLEMEDSDLIDKAIKDGTLIVEKKDGED